MKELCEACNWVWGSDRCKGCIHWFEDRFEKISVAVRSSEQSPIEEEK